MSSNPRMSFGKYNDKPIYLLNSNYLKWLLEQDWFEEKDDFEEVNKEWNWREKTNNHFYEDKIN